MEPQTRSEPGGRKEGTGGARRRVNVAGATSPPPRRFAGRAAILIGVAVIVLAGLVARLPLLDKGLHSYLGYFPDEFTEVAQGDAVRTQGIAPSFAEPQLLANLLALEQRLLGLDATDPAREILFGRALQLLFACVITVLTFSLGRSLGGDATGLLAAYFFALSPVSVAATGYLRQDVLLALCALVLFLAVLRLHRPEIPGPALVAAAGGAAGLVASAKHHGIALLAWAGVACVAALWGRGWRKTAAFGCLFGASTVAVYLAVNRSLFVYFSAFCREFLFLLGYYGRGHSDGIAIRFFDFWGLYYLLRAIGPGLGWGVTAAALVGCLQLTRSRGRERVTVLLCSFVVSYYLVLELSPTKPYPFFARYVLPILPQLCVCAATCVASIVGHGYRSRSARWLALAVAAAVLLNPLAVAVLSSAWIERNDTRQVAARWMEAQGDGACFVNESGGRPHKLGQYYPWPSREGFAYQRWGQQDCTGRTTYLVVSSFWYGRFFEVSSRSGGRDEPYRQLFRAGQVAAEFAPVKLTYGFLSPTITVYKVGERGALPESLPSTPSGRDR